VFVAIEVLVAHCGSFDGTSTELFGALGQIASDGKLGATGSPESSIALGMLLKNKAPRLCEIGIWIEFERTEDTRSTTIRRTRTNVAVERESRNTPVIRWKSFDRHAPPCALTTSDYR
jgi:hypothetical protein